MQILMAVMMATFMLMMVPRAAVCAERIVEVLDTESSVVPATAPVTELPHPGRAGAARGAASSTRARRTPVLRDISFRATPGTTTAIIGSTGAGKTTLLSLIPRLFDVTAGAVLVDGVDVRDFDPDELWRRIGLVPQRPYLFTGTVATNLRYGNPDATDEELWTRAGDRPGPGLRGRRCPAGWTPRSPRAAPTSPAASGSGWPSPGRWSGSRRSTCSTTRSPRSTWPPTPGCARRCGRSPRESTVVIVAQRVSTIVDADQIIVLEDGAGRRRRTHAELLETCPTYAEIVESQLTTEVAA